MSRLLITSGPTREYLDPVRYLSNASSGRMGRALACAALAAGHEVVVVSGPVEVDYPPAARVLHVVSTEEMLEACRRVFPGCNGLIAAAAPCDYRPQRPWPHKRVKTGTGWNLTLVETPDILGDLGASKGGRWVVGFALETENAHAHALEKLRRKQCDLIIVNGPEALRAPQTQVEILDPQGRVLASPSGNKEDVAKAILEVIHRHLIAPAH